MGGSTGNISGNYPCRGGEEAPDKRRLICGVRAGGQELTDFRGGDNMLMALAVGNAVAEAETVIHVDRQKGEVKLTLDGRAVLPETPVQLQLAEGFNSFVIEAESRGIAETVFLNVERLPAGLYSEATRPVYHFTPYRYQMNDPNGLVYDENTGLYHLFFQCNRPFASGVEEKTRTTGWGHAVSKDLINWKELQMALTPDRLGAAWSGSGVIDRDNVSGLFDGSVPPESRLMVFYASVFGDETCGMAKISMAYSKDGGNTWIKYPGNPVVKNTGNRFGAGLRDPKVIRLDGSVPGQEDLWLMVTCGDTHLFASKDLVNWEEQGGIVVDAEGKVIECECPDLFRLPVDGDEGRQKWILTCGGVSYVIGELKVDVDGRIRFEAETTPIVNLNGIADQIPGIKAPEIYATQTFFSDPLGRRVSMSWIRDPYQEWQDKIWNSAQSLPLVNTLRTVDGKLRLFRYPVEELETVRDKLLFSARDVKLTASSGNILEGLRSDCFDLTAVITPGSAKNIEFAVRAGADGQDALLKVRWSAEENRLYVTKGGDGWQGVYEPETHLDKEGKLRLRIMLDRICYDIFGNGGEAAVQGILYPLTSADGLAVCVDGDATVDSLEVWSMALPSGGVCVSRDTY